MTQAIASFDFVNTDHLVHLRDLKIISDQYTLNIIDSTMKVRSRQLPWAEAQKRLEQARQTVKDKWAAHPTDDFVGEEKKLVDKIEASFDKVNGLLDQLSTIYKDEEREDLGKFTDRQLYPAVEELTELLSEFMEAQLTEANNEFMTAQESYEFNRNLTIGLIVIGLLGGLLLAASIIRTITQPLSKVQETVGAIEKSGNFSLRIDVTQEDEVGQTAKAINRMLTSQQSAVAEVNQVVTALAGGDFNPRIQADLKGDLGDMKKAVNTSAEASRAPCAT